MMTVTITKAGLALCAALGIADCADNQDTEDALFSEWMNTRGDEMVFYCNPRGCHSIKHPHGELPPGARCYVPMDYYNDAVTEYEDRGNYVFCESAPQS